MAIRITQNRKVRARCDLAYRLCVPNPLIFRLICTVSAYFCFLAVPAIAADEETKNVKAKDLHVCGVSPEVLEERSFEDASSKIYSLSTNPEGKKCLQEDCSFVCSLISISKGTCETLFWVHHWHTSMVMKTLGVGLECLTHHRHTGISTRSYLSDIASNAVLIFFLDDA